MERPSKRQKVLVASSKAKCDGVGPVCRPCQSRVRKTGIQCTWSDSTPRDASSMQIQALQDRIAYLEGIQHRSRPDGARGSDRSCDRVHSRTRLDNSGSPHGDERPSMVRLNPESAARQQDEPPPVYTIIGPTERSENREGFFGSSNAGTFMQSVRALVDQRLHGTNSESRHFLQPSDHGRMESWFPNHQPVRHDSAEQSLPLRKAADELMSVYWQDVHIMFPILDHQQTRQQYERLWTGEDEPSNPGSFLCLLNAMFALSSQLNPAISPTDRAYTSSRYYSRATALLDVWQTSSLQTVQSLILLAMYCQSSDKAHQCWILTGMAIRISQALGLHLVGASERAPDARTKERLRTVWYGCVQLDRIASMTYGRPCGVGERLATAVHLPSSANSEEHLSVPTHTMDHFNLLTRLYHNLHEILYSLCAPAVIQVQTLEELYDRYFRHVPADPNKPSVIDIEGSLQRWHDSIPVSMRANSFEPTSNESIIRRQAVTLEQHYLHVRLLLLRPFLSAVITLDPDIRLPSELAAAISLQCAVACVRVAQEAIKLVHCHRPANIASIGSTETWWFNVLFVYTAATVLNASLLSPPIVKELSEASILESWQLALSILDDYTVFGGHIKRLVMTLRVLFETVPRQYSKHKQSRQQRRAQSDLFADTPLRTDGASASQDPTAPTVLLQSDSAQAPLPEPNFDCYSSADGLWDLGFDALDLSWLTSLPTDSTI